MDVASLKVFITMELSRYGKIFRWYSERIIGLKYFWIFFIFLLGGRIIRDRWISKIFFWKIESIAFRGISRLDSLAFWEILAWGARTFLYFFSPPPQNSILSTLRNSFSNERAENFAWNFPILFPSFFFKRGTFQFREAILRVEE